MFRFLALLVLAFCLYRFCWGLWLGYKGREIEGGDRR